MAKLKVSELTRTANINGTDLVYVVQGINSRATTVANLFLASNVVGPSGPPGPPGSAGPSGPPGPGGLDATSIKQFSIAANNQANAYFFTGFGFQDDASTPNPSLYFYRGFEYQIVNSTVDAHPLLIKYSANGNVFSSLGYSQNLVNIEGLGNVETIFLVVPYSAPDTLYYQSNTNPNLGNVIYIR